MVRNCVQRRPAGIVCFQLTEEMLSYISEEMNRYRIRCAVAGATFVTGWDVHVSSDDPQGCDEVIRHLVELGHRRIAFIAGEPLSPSAVARETAYRDAMERFELDVPPTAVGQVKRETDEGKWDAEETERVATQLLSPRKDRPTAVFCAADYIAFVVLRVARRLGLNVPNDLSVVGFSNLRSAEYSDPALTTAARPWKEMGEAAIKGLLEPVHRPGETFQRGKLLPVQLVVRRSTARAKEFVV